MAAHHVAVGVRPVNRTQGDKMNEEDVLITMGIEGIDAEDLLRRADPKLITRFKRLDKSLINLLKDVQEHFPDACYYTASGGFNLLLGSSHTDDGKPQQDMLAVSGYATIGDGDW